MKLKDIFNMNSNDIIKLSIDELRNTVKYTDIVVNSRIQNIEKNNLQHFSSAYENITQRGNIKTVENMTKNELITKLQDNTNFLTDSTSTIKGIKGTQKYFSKNVKNYDDLNERQKNRFWREYKKFKEDKNAKEIFGDTNQLMNDFYDIMYGQGTYVKNEDVQNLAEQHFEDLYNNLIESDETDLPF